MPANRSPKLVRVDSELRILAQVRTLYRVWADEISGNPIGAVLWDGAGALKELHKALRAPRRKRVAARSKRKGKK